MNILNESFMNDIDNSYNHIIDNEYNYNSLIESVGIYELSCIDESDYQKSEILENKVKTFINGIIKKIKMIYESVIEFISKIKSKMKSINPFVNKLKTIKYYKDYTIDRYLDFNWNASVDGFTFQEPSAFADKVINSIEEKMKTAHTREEVHHIQKALNDLNNNFVGMFNKTLYNISMDIKLTPEIVKECIDSYYKIDLLKEQHQCNQLCNKINKIQDEQLWNLDFTFEFHFNNNEPSVYRKDNRIFIVECLKYVSMYAQLYLEGKRNEFKQASHIIMVAFKNIDRQKEKGIFTKSDDTSTRSNFMAPAII